jgi:hypothetical protein
VDFEEKVKGKWPMKIVQIAENQLEGCLDLIHHKLFKGGKNGI